jgi:Tol biopolymer transport system component
MSTAVALLLLLVPLSGHGDDLVVQHLDGSARVSLTGGSGLVSQYAWSPDGSHVAFASGATIYVVDPDGRNLRAVASGGDPTWSPDGSQLAFLNGPFSATDVWTVPSGGGTPRRLTADGGDKRRLSWSPDGSTILYARAVSGDDGLFALDPVTGGTRQLSTVSFSGSGTAGVWSPDGTQVAFVDHEGHLAVMAPDGSAVRVLDSQFTVDSPSWSSDGATLSFAARRNLPEPPSRYGPYTTTDVWAVDVGSGAERRLTGPSDDVTQTPWSFVPSTAPQWWPDNSRLFFVRNVFSGTKVWQMNADGSCEQQIGTVADAPPVPAWQPGRPVGVDAVRCADLRLRIVASPGPIALGASGESSVVLENDGNLPATNVHVRFSTKQPARVTLSGCDGIGDCSFGTLQPGAVQRFQAVLGELSSPGSIVATISATGDQVDPTPADATVATSVDVPNCTIAGTWGADVLTGTLRADRICGFPGADRIEGGAGDDYLDAGNGNDTIVGGPGRDTIIARGGRDVIYARDGQLDWIDCGTEYDIAIVDRIDHTHHCEKVVRR